MPLTTARAAFADLLALRDVRAVDVRSLVDPATDLLVAGFDGPGVVDLASAVVDDRSTPPDIEEVVRAARAELALPALEGAAAVLRAVQAMVRRWQRGEVSDRQLTRWAHEHVGHGQDPALEALVDADDAIDAAAFGPDHDRHQHQHLRRITDSVLSLPDPWATDDGC